MKSGSKKVYDPKPGDEFGLLTVIEEIRIGMPGRRGQRGLLCSCACGTTVARPLVPVCAGLQHSCGCKGRVTDMVELALRRSIRQQVEDAGFTVELVRLRRRADDG